MRGRACVGKQAREWSVRYPEGGQGVAVVVSSSGGERGSERECVLYCGNVCREVAVVGVVVEGEVCLKR